MDCRSPPKTAVSNRHTKKKVEEGPVSKKKNVPAQAEEEENKDDLMDDHIS